MKLYILTLTTVITLTLVHARPQETHTVQSEKHNKVSFLPYYGGAKGQTLKVTELINGTVTYEIIQTPFQNLTTSEPTNVSELEMPTLPQRPTTSDYNLNLRNIHQTAINILKLQEAAKKYVKFNKSDELEYREAIDSLNVAAENLAKINDEEDDLDFSDKAGLSPWFERKKTFKKDKQKEEERIRKEEQIRKEDEEKRRKAEEEEEERRKKEELEEEKRRKEGEDKKKKEQEKENEKEEEEEDEENDAVTVNLPPKDASVAEAKPIGLAIAGIGGVAASKPIATAVVGPGGLAIARPVGTAIAGVSPDQALVPIYAEADDPPRKGSKPGNKEEKKKIGTSEYLNRIISRYHQN